MYRAIRRTAARQSRAKRTALFAAFLVAAVLPFAAPVTAQDATVTIDVDRDNQQLLYIGTDADTDLLIRVADGNITFVNRGDEVFGDIDECEYVPSGGPDEPERAVCPIQDLHSVWLYAGGATTRNRIIAPPSENRAPVGLFVTGGAARDIVRLSRGFGSDGFWGHGGDDLFVGGRGSGYSEARGGPGDDVLRDGLGFSDFNGGSGNDRLIGGGGQRRDFLIGGEDDDVLLGGVGPDRLRDGSGSDVLYGGQGRDRLYGRDDGRASHDHLYCGEGRDFATSDWRDLVGVRCEVSTNSSGR